MRKLREAALVAAMVGGIGMIGTGAASAQGETEEPGNPTIVCNYDAGDGNGTTQNGLINVNGPLIGGGSAESTGVQQICGIDNDGNINQPGGAAGGAGGDGTISVGATAGLIDGLLGGV